MTFSLDSQSIARVKTIRQRRKGKRPSTQRNKFQTRRLFLECLEDRRVLAGSWTNLAASGAGPANGQMMMLLSDGSVLVQGGSNQASSTIFKLTPQANTGDYVNGVWSDIDDLNEGRLFYTTTMLPDGRVFAVGGEYPRFTNTAEIYDPLTDTWSFVAPVPTNPTNVFLSGAITGASNTNPITISTTSRTSALNNGQQVTIAGVGGNTNANGVWTIANLTGNSFDLVGSVGNAAYIASPTDTWTSIPAAVSQFGDGVIEMLPDGQILAGQFSGSFRYNAATDTWTATGAKVRGNSSNEETWVILPDESILSYDIRSSATNGVLQGQRYIRSTDSWVDASNLDPFNPPAVLSGAAQGNELGPMFLQPDGNVFVFGANGNNAIYNPTTDLWSAGPQSPQKILTLDPDGSGDFDVVVPGPSPVATFIVATDDPGAMLPNGHILIALSPLGPNVNGYTFPLASYIYEYDPVAQTFTENTPPGLSAENAYQLNMVVLPSGQVLLANAQGVFQVYTPDPLVPTQDEWRPVITGIANNGGGTFTLTGLQLNGISEGANYGDDYMSSTNYPIIELNDGGNISYARTFNWSNTGVATGSTPVSTQFTLPAGTDLSDFDSLRVIANGIPSLPVAPVELGAGQENLVIRVDPIDSNIVQVLIDGSGAVVATFPNNSATPISIVGNGNNNRVVIDETYGNVNTPVQFDGGGTTGAPGDRLLVMGSSGDDALNLSPSSLTSASMVFNGSNPYSFLNITQFAFFGGAGNDTMTVDDGAAITSVPLYFDGDNAFAFSGDVTFNSIFGNVNFEGHGSYTGGNGFDQLILLNTSVGGPAITGDRLSPGATFGSGQSTVTAGIGSQNLFFQNLEPIIDLLPSPNLNIVSIPGFASILDASNAINYVDGGGGTGRVTIDGFEPITFGNKNDLTISAGAGSDVINLNNPNLPTGFTPGGLKTITVNGGDPTASDTLIVNGNVGELNNLQNTPTNVGAGTVLDQNGSVVTTNYTGLEHLLLVVQQADNDGVRIDGTLGDDEFEHIPGATADAGTFRGTMDRNDATGNGPFTMVEVSFKGTLQAVGFDIDVNTTNDTVVQQGNDSLIYNGTGGNDQISVTNRGTNDVTITNTINGNLFDNMDVFNVVTLLVRGHDGDDTFAHAGNVTVSTTYEGGNPSASDVLNFAGSGAAVTVDLAANSIQSAGGSLVTTSGVERINVTSGTSLTVNGTAGEDSINFIPTASGAGSFTAASSGAVVASYPQYTYAVTGGSTLTLNTLGTFDTVGLAATSGNDVVNAIQSTASALSYTQNAFTQLFAVTNLEKVKLSTLGGDDLIRISVSDTLVATPASSLAFDVDAGEPNASDRLIVDDDGIGDLTIIRQAPDQRSGSVTVGALNLVFYQNTERLDVTPINSVTGGVGTDGDGRIEVFHSDPFEYNDTRLTPATLSRVGENPTRPTIDPGAVVAPFAVPGDEDWYDFRPQATGTFAVKILFDIQGTLANGRAGLPGSGDMNLDIYDALGGLITSGVVTSGGKIATFAATPDAAQFARIFVRVRGATSDSINRYEFDNLDGVGTGNPGVINVDIFGPQVTDVLANSIPTATYNLFGQKPANAAFKPTPLVNSLTIQLRDLPARAPGFLYNAIDPNTATTPGTYVVKGDATGIAVISSIVLVNNLVVQGGVPTASIQINFAQPLPDDRFTLTINDNLLDPAGNKLDGESNAAEPNAAPTFPSGDDHSGNAFIARFTVDSRAELGAWAAGSVYVDTNGNNLFDPTNTDATNRDITYLMGFASDNIFAGNFVKAPAGAADGFDKLAAYGKFGASFRWLIDVNNDGIVNASDVNVVQPLFAGVTSVNGTPVAGNFDGNAANGDEVALKVGTTWLLDTNHDFKVDTKLPGTNMSGLPITGDFDGDGKEDLGAWADDLFKIDFGFNGLTGNSDLNFGFGFISVRERPVASDFDGDGITDLGLWVPDRAGVAPAESAEWYLLISAGRSLWTRNAESGGIVFKPAPFGSDRYAQFGDEFGLPVPGNFDPPITPTQPSGSFTNSRDNFDVDNDGFVSPIDALLVINRLNSGDTTMVSTPFTHAPFVDVNGDGSCSPIDALIIINKLNAANGNSAGEGEGETADSFFAELGSESSSDASFSALLAFDDYHLNRKK